MFKSIRTYFARKRKKNRINQILRLIYTKEYTLDELIAAEPKCKDEMELIEKLVLIRCAAVMVRPLTEDDLDTIFEEEIASLRKYLDLYNARQTVIDYEKSVTNVKLFEFYYSFQLLRFAYQRDEYSLEGIRYSRMKAKLGPLSPEEEAEIRVLYNRLKEANDNLKRIEKEIELRENNS